MKQHDLLFEPLQLPCGVTLKNRLAKSAMSDSLGDGTGHPTIGQIRLYERWAKGGASVAIIGEVQGSPNFIEKQGNLVLDGTSNLERFTSTGPTRQPERHATVVAVGPCWCAFLRPDQHPQGAKRAQLA